MPLQHPHYPRITMDPAICSGKPCIRGLRFPITTLLGYLAGGMSVEQLRADFPFLEQEDVLESLAFAAAAMDETYMSLVSEQAARA